MDRQAAWAPEEWADGDGEGGAGKREESNPGSTTQHYIGSRLDLAHFDTDSALLKGVLCRSDYRLYGFWGF